MPNGICKPGYSLDAGACGNWRDGGGGRPRTEGKTDAQMKAAGNTCAGTCGDIDRHHRTNPDPNGGEGCVGVYNFYGAADSGNVNCCQKGMPFTALFSDQRSW